MFFFSLPALLLFVFKVSISARYFLTLVHTLQLFLQSFYYCTFLRGAGWLLPCALQGTETMDPGSGPRAPLSRELVGVEKLNRTALFRRRCGWSALVRFHQCELKWMSLCRPVNTISIIAFFVLSVSEQGESNGLD